MMDREKEIEEMAVILTDGGCTKCNCDENGKFDCLPMYNAELLYNAGYRKQSEIFEEIDNIIYNLRDSPFYSSSDAVDELTELKKKYTGEKEDAEIH